MEDILLIDKPKGISSFDVIRRLRRILNIRKMGFAGTLDPAATGLLIVGIEKGTKKLTEFTALDKVYEMEVLLGVQTDSGDLDGQILKEVVVPEIDQEKVKLALKQLTGKIEITIPLYSAVKIDGKRLYKYAREGKKVESPKRLVEIYSLKLLDSVKCKDKAIIKVELHCQKGTYARSVAEEIGKKLELPATVKELRRTKVGNFSVEEAKTIEEIDKRTTNYPPKE